MVHGLGACSVLWVPLLAELSGFTFYAIDLPGHGLTPALDRGLESTELRRTMVTFLSGALDSLELQAPATFIGNSLGSLCSTWLALDRPERVRALVHIGSPAVTAGASAPLGMRIGSVGGLGPALLNLRPPSRRQMEALAGALHDSLRGSPELSDVLVAQDEGPGFKDTLRRLTRSLVRVRGARPEVALTSEKLGELKQPVQLVWGDNDPFGPLDIAYAAWAAIPDAQLEVVPGGHAPWFTSAPAVASPVRSFLHRHAGIRGLPAR